MKKTIRVTGKGKISVKPDTIRLRITQTDVHKDYEETIKESTKQKSRLNKVLTDLGFQPEDLKTVYFNVDTEEERYRAKDDSWKRRFLGYRYTHRMKLEFPLDNARLGKVLYAIARMTGRPEFSIEHTVSDPEAAKNELLAKAIADARTKAQVLTTAAGVALGEIKFIDYSWGEIEFVSRPMDRMAPMYCKMSAPEDDSYDIDIEADDIDVTDTVTVVWNIA